VNIYCNRFHGYRCSDSLLESRSWLVVVVVADKKGKECIKGKQERKPHDQETANIDDYDTSAK